MTTSLVQSITDEQIAEIEALANAATQGPWHHATDVGQIGSVDVGDRVLAQAQQLEPKDNAHRDRNAAYIASVYPQVLLALISRLRAAERDAARWRYARDILTVEAIETAQSDFINFGLPAAESESLRADAAIDTAMKGDQQ